MAKEMERSGLPTVQVTNLVSVAASTGARRILQGRAIPHVFGDPSLSPEEERELRRQLTEAALHLLAAPGVPDTRSRHTDANSPPR